MNDYVYPPPVPAPKHPRLLRETEIVRAGDFVEGRGGYVPWEGPAGFQASAFIKPTYRENAPATTGLARGKRKSPPAAAPGGYVPALSVPGRR